MQRPVSGSHMWPGSLHGEHPLKRPLLDEKWYPSFTGYAYGCSLRVKIPRTQVDTASIGCLLLPVCTGIVHSHHRNFRHKSPSGHRCIFHSLYPSWCSSSQTKSNRDQSLKRFKLKSITKHLSHLRPVTLEAHWHWPETSWHFSSVAPFGWQSHANRKMIG